eukprot:COSAG01_NODE_76670_length_179_cov_217.975000_1_plen_40_part_01
MHRGGPGAPPPPPPRSFTTQMYTQGSHTSAATRVYIWIAS